MVSEITTPPPYRSLPSLCKIIYFITVNACEGVWVWVWVAGAHVSV